MSFVLPALRCLGDLADVSPIIARDTREQDPLVFTRVATQVQTLYTGDYSIVGLEESWAVERKTLPDYLGSITGSNRERFMREMLRLRGYRWKRLLIIGSYADLQSGAYRSECTPAAAIATLLTISVRWDVPVVFAEDKQAAALLIEDWVWAYSREMVVTVNALARGVGLTSRGRTTPKAT